MLFPHKRHFHQKYEAHLQSCTKLSTHFRQNNRPRCRIGLHHSQRTKENKVKNAILPHIFCMVIIPLSIVFSHKFQWPWPNLKVKGASERSNCKLHIPSKFLKHSSLNFNDTQHTFGGLQLVTEGDTSLFLGMNRVLVLAFSSSFSSFFFLTARSFKFCRMITPVQLKLFSTH